VDKYECYIEMPSGDLLAVVAAELVMAKCLIHSSMRSHGWEGEDVPTEIIASVIFHGAVVHWHGCNFRPTARRV
jgi:hypothetical protein